MSKLADWHQRAQGSAELALAQAHLDAMTPMVRNELLAMMQAPPGEEDLALLFALTARADQLAAIPILRVSHTDVMPLRRD